MSLAQPTLDLLMLEQITILKTTMESLNKTINENTESINLKLNALNEKVDKQDIFIRKSLEKGGQNSKQALNNNTIDTEISDNIKNIISDVNVNDKNIKLNRTEIENLYRVINNYKDDNKNIIKNIGDLKSKLETVSNSSSKTSIDIIDKLNSYIIELKTSKEKHSYAEATQPCVVNIEPNDEAPSKDTTEKYHNNYTKPYNNYNRNSYKSNYHKRYQSHKESSNSDEEGWQTVKSKKKTNHYSRY